MNRELGEELALSVGTALAIEPLMRGDIQVAGYDCIHINIRTLYRNYHGSFEDPMAVDLKAYTDGLLSEVENILAMLQGTLKPVLYIMTNKSLRTSVSRYAKIKEDRTPNQLNYTGLEKWVLNALNDRLDDELIVKWDCAMRGENLKTLLITSFPLDLVSANTFRRCDLLESHTGEIRHRSKWISKLSTNPDYANIPFTIMALQVIGDKATQFNALRPGYRKALIRLSRERNWNATTTNAKLVADLNSERDKLVGAVLLDMLRVKLK